MKKINVRKKMSLTQKERKFLLENETCRIATSYNDIPHVVPVAYVFEKGNVTFVTDYGTKKYKNLEVNKNISVVVDVYDPLVENKAIVMQGKAVII